MLKNKISIVASCGVQGCCPTVELIDDQVMLKDDFGNVAKMNKAQWMSLAQQSVSQIKD